MKKNLMFFHSANGSGSIQPPIPPVDPIQTLVDEYVANVALTAGDTVESTAPYTAIYNELSRLDSSGEWAAGNSWSILKEGGLKKDGSDLVSYVYPLKKVAGSWVKSVQTASARFPVHTAGGFFTNADTRRYLRFDSINFAKDSFEISFRANINQAGVFCFLQHAVAEASYSFLLRNNLGLVSWIYYSDAQVLEASRSIPAEEYAIVDSVLDFRIVFERTGGTTVVMKFYVNNVLIYTSPSDSWTGTVNGFNIGNSGVGTVLQFKVLESFNIKKI